MRDFQSELELILKANTAQAAAELKKLGTEMQRDFKQSAVALSELNKQLTSLKTAATQHQQGFSAALRANAAEQKQATQEITRLEKEKQSSINTTLKVVEALEKAATKSSAATQAALKAEEQAYTRTASTLQREYVKAKADLAKASTEEAKASQSLQRFYQGEGQILTQLANLERQAMASAKERGQQGQEGARRVLADVARQKEALADLYAKEEKLKNLEDSLSQKRDDAALKLQAYEGRQAALAQQHAAQRARFLQQEAAQQQRLTQLQESAFATQATQEARVQRLLQEKLAILKQLEAAQRNIQQTASGSQAYDTNGIQQVQRAIRETQAEMNRMRRTQAELTAATQAAVSAQRLENEVLSRSAALVREVDAANRTASQQLERSARLRLQVTKAIEDMTKAEEKANKEHASTAQHLAALHPLLGRLTSGLQSTTSGWQAKGAAVRALPPALTAVALPLAAIFTVFQGLGAVLSAGINLFQSLFRTLSTGAQALQATVLHAGELANQVRTLQSVTGMTAREASAFHTIFQAIGGATFVVNAGFAQLVQKMGEGEPAFKRLNVAIENQNGTLRNVKDVVLDLAGAYEHAGNKTDVIANLSKIWGGWMSGTMLPMLAMGREKLEDFLTTADRLGLTMNEQVVSGAVGARNAVLLLHRALDMIQVLFASALEPVITRFVAYFLENFRRIREVVMEVGMALASLIQGLASGLGFAQPAADTLRFVKSLTAISAAGEGASQTIGDVSTALENQRNQLKDTTQAYEENNRALQSQLLGARQALKDLEQQHRVTERDMQNQANALERLIQWWKAYYDQLIKTANGALKQAQKELKQLNKDLADALKPSKDRLTEVTRELNAIEREQDKIKNKYDEWRTPIEARKNQLTELINALQLRRDQAIDSFNAVIDDARERIQMLREELEAALAPLEAALESIESQMEALSEQEDEEEARPSPAAASGPDVTKAVSDLTEVAKVASEAEVKLAALRQRLQELQLQAAIGLGEELTADSLAVQQAAATLLSQSEAYRANELAIEDALRTQQSVMAVNLNVLEDAFHQHQQVADTLKEQLEILNEQWQLAERQRQQRERLLAIEDALGMTELGRLQNELDALKQQEPLRRRVGESRTEFERRLRERELQDRIKAIRDERSLAKAQEDYEREQARTEYERQKEALEQRVAAEQEAAKAAEEAWKAAGKAQEEIADRLTTLTREHEKLIEEARDQALASLKAQQEAAKELVTGRQAQLEIDQEIASVQAEIAALEKQIAEEADKANQTQEDGLSTAQKTQNTIQQTANQSKKNHQRMMRELQKQAKEIRRQMNSLRKAAETKQKAEEASIRASEKARDAEKARADAAIQSLTTQREQAETDLRVLAALMDAELAPREARARQLRDDAADLREEIDGIEERYRPIIEAKEQQIEGLQNEVEGLREELDQITGPLEESLRTHRQLIDDTKQAHLEERQVLEDAIQAIQDRRDALQNAYVEDKQQIEDLIQTTSRKFDTFKADAIKGWQEIGEAAQKAFSGDSGFAPGADPFGPSITDEAGNAFHRTATVNKWEQIGKDIATGIKKAFGDDWKEWWKDQGGKIVTWMVEGAVEAAKTVSWMGLKEYLKYTIAHGETPIDTVMRYPGRVAAEGMTDEIRKKIEDDPKDNRPFWQKALQKFSEGVLEHGITPGFNQHLKPGLKAETSRVFEEGVTDGIAAAKQPERSLGDYARALGQQHGRSLDNQQRNLAENVNFSITEGSDKGIRASAEELPRSEIATSLDLFTLALLEALQNALDETFGATEASDKQTLGGVVLDAIMAGLKTGFDATADAIASDEFKPTIDKLGEALTAALETSFHEKITSVLTSMRTDLEAWFKDLITYLESEDQTLWTPGVAANWEKLRTGVQDVLAALFDVEEGGPSGGGSAGASQPGAAAQQQQSQQQQKAVGKLKQWWQQLQTFLTDVAKPWENAAKTNWTEFYEQIAGDKGDGSSRDRGIFPSLTLEIEDWWAGPEGIKAKLDSWEPWSAAVQKHWQEFFDGIKKVFDDLRSPTDGVPAWSKAVVDAMGEAFALVWAAIQPGIQQAFTNVKVSMQAIGQVVNDLGRFLLAEGDLVPLDQIGASATIPAKTTGGGAGVFAIENQQYGGIHAPVPGGKVVRIAEAGEPEAVVPISYQNPSLTRGLLKQIARTVGMGGVGDEGTDLGGEDMTSGSVAWGTGGGLGVRMPEPGPALDALIERNYLAIAANENEFAQYIDPLGDDSGLFVATGAKALWDKTMNPLLGTLRGFRALGGAMAGVLQGSTLLNSIKGMGNAESWLISLQKFFGMLHFPKTGPITQGFGMSDFAAGGAYGGFSHTGIDIGGGGLVSAPAAGILSSVADTGIDGPGGGYGFHATMQHTPSLSTLYAHLDRLIGLLKPVGSMLRRGEPFAVADNTGYSTGTHLHWETRENGSPTDPMAYLRKILRETGVASGRAVTAPPLVQDAIRKAIETVGVGGDWLSGLMIIAEHESGFLPTAVNPQTVYANGQSFGNATGLFQTLPSTFAAYALPGLNDIMDAYHNAVAAIRYILARYGHPDSTPGVRSLRAGGPYLPFKHGGMAGIGGPELSLLGDGGMPELVVDGETTAMLARAGLVSMQRGNFAQVAGPLRDEARNVSGGRGVAGGSSYSTTVTASAVFAQNPKRTRAQEEAWFRNLVRDELRRGKYGG